jgi:uncharacterized membrane protein
MTTSTLTALALAVGGAAVVATTGQGTLAGAVAGLVVAWTAILGLGPGALLPLATFVLGSGVLTRLGRGRKEAMGAAEGNRGRRGARHVAAKLGLPALLGACGLLRPGGHALELAYAAALSGALADTAATEIGPLGKGPVMGVRGRRVLKLEHGEPGGMSALGLVASAAGALAAATAAEFSGLVSGRASWCVAAAAGFGAATLESMVAGTALGRAMGHFGRNVMVSAVSVAVALVASRWMGSGA